MKKIALITGANKGIGLEICKQLAKQNFNVILTSRDSEKGKNAAININGDVDFHQLDVTDDKSISEIADFVKNKFGKLDVLINNAGIGVGNKGALADLTGGYAGYRLSKSSLNTLTILLASELSKTEIKINAMCPGWVRTDMGGANASRSVEKGAETAVWLATEKTIQTGKFFRDKKIISW